MIRRAVSLTALLALAGLLFASNAAAASGPRWHLESVANTSAAPGSTLTYNVFAYDDGTEATTPGACPGAECQTLTIALPEGLSVAEVTPVFPDWECSVVDSRHVSCTAAGEFPARVGKENPVLLLIAEVQPGASGTLSAAFTVEGGGAAGVTIHDPTEITEEAPGFGVDAFETAAEDASEAPYFKAAGHPYGLTAQIDFNRGTDPLRGMFWPAGSAKDTVVELPPGLIGDPGATGGERCTAAQLANHQGVYEAPLCPPASQVGVALVRANYGGLVGALAVGPLSLFEMPPPPGVAARFGFNVLGTIVTLDATVRGGGDYGIDVTSRNIPQALALFGTEVAFWGVPAAASHEPPRSCPGEVEPHSGGPSCAAEAEETAFLRLPTACTEAGEGLATTVRADSYEEPGAWKEASAVSREAPGYPYPVSEQGAPHGPEGCASEPFSPSVSVAPTTNRADSPSGLDLHIRMPQQGLTDPSEEVASESDLRKAVVRLPAGMSVNPSSAGGLGACTSAQIGLLGTDFPEPAPIHFTDAAPNCPNASKIGTATIETPLLDHPVKTGVYLAAQNDNPFHSLLALYIAGEDEASGVVLKLAGQVEADPSTGQLTTTFDDQPQLPFEDLHLELFGGPRAALRTPGCGTHSSTATLTPWSGNPAVTRTSSFQITQGCGGGFDPTLHAGTTNPVAGHTSPFVLRLTRQDAEQQLSGLTATLPPGLSGYLKGIPYCSDSALAGISGALGAGAGETASPACPAASEVGTVTVGAGAGSDPFYVTSGRAYLAGPYKGAPLSLAAVVPAVAGPFDLGSVMVRNKIEIDPETAQLTVVSDPLPQILHGIPLDLRDIRVNVDREGFTVNPTDCEAMQIASQIASVGGATASPAERFQVGGCRKLGFKPHLYTRVWGKTTRGAHPKLRTVLVMPKADQANIARAVVTLPRSELLDQAHIRTTCTRVQYNAGAGGGAECPKGSIYGYAKAYTPLLDKPLRGPVFLRSNGGKRELPDLVASLNGQIHIDLVGFIDSVHARIRTRFLLVPDAPVRAFVLYMKGGRKGLLVNDTNVCERAFRANAGFAAHNGRRALNRPVLVNKRCVRRWKRLKASRHKRAGRHRRAGQRPRRRVALRAQHRVG